jgi:hypothetical protein
MTRPREDDDTIAHLLDRGEIVLARSTGDDQALLQRLPPKALWGRRIVTQGTLVRRHRKA